MTQFQTSHFIMPVNNVLNDERRWRGSVWKLIYAELFIWSLCYTVVSLVYRHSLNDAYRTHFEHLAIFCNKYTSALPVTFVLGFYVSVVLRRWWDIYLNIAWPDKAALMIATFCKGNADESRVFRRMLVRYLMLSEVMVFRSISSAVKNRFPTMEHVMQAGLITESEMKLLAGFGKAHSMYWVPIQWCCTHIKLAGDNHSIDDFTQHKLIEPILEFKANLGSLLAYDWISVPLVYTQVVTIAVRSYFAMCVVGRQYLDPKQQYDHTQVDLYMPLFTILEFIFFVGWLKVAEALINPWGEDDDDYEINYIIDRNFQIGYSMVDDNYDVAPKPEPDMHFDQFEPSLPHTQASVQLRRRKKLNPMIGSCSNIKVPISQSKLALLETQSSSGDQKSRSDRSAPLRSQSQPMKKTFDATVPVEAISLRSLHRVDESDFEDSAASATTLTAPAEHSANQTSTVTISVDA